MYPITLCLTPFTCHQDPVKQKRGRGRPARPHPRPPQAERTTERCVYNSGHKVYDPQVPPTVIRPQDDATTSQPYPRGRCQLLKLRPTGSSGGGEGQRLPPEASLDKSPTKGRVLPGGHPQQDFNQGREGKKFVFLSFFFFYHTKMLRILNLLILSALLVKGRKLQGCSGR